MFDLIDTLGRAFLGQARTEARAEITANGMLVGAEVQNLAQFPMRDLDDKRDAVAA